MSTVNSTSSSNSPLQQLMQGTSSAVADASSAEGIEDRFLTLLVTQMQNQDPLNPMENAELTSQLAQINTVKGISSLNSTLDKLLTSYSDAMSMQSSALIGKNVLSAGNKLPLGESGAIGGFSLAGPADKVTVTIANSDGIKVSELKLDGVEAGVNDFYWDGKDADGNALAQGNYSFSVAATQGGNSVETSALQLGMVSALVRTSNGFQLELMGGGQLDFGAVQQIY